MNMTLPEQKAKNGLELRDSRDLLEKLDWELRNLDFRQPYDIAVCQYHVFNCAVTAWTVTDWLWKDISPELREKLKDKNGKPLKERKDFRGYVSAACPALELCRQIANGSKHGQFERNISAVISDSEGYDYGNPIIMEGDTQHRADKVFYDALKWFEAFLRNERVFPEELFVPKGA